MDKVTAYQDNQILEYLDGKLDGAELQSFRMALEGSEAMRRRLDALRPVHRFLASAKLESPSEGFTPQVMRQVASARPISGLSARNGLLLAAGIMAAAGILAVLVSTGALGQATELISLKQPTGMDKYLPSVPSFTISVKMIVNFSLAVSLVVTFLVLDRTVLRPFFQRRAGTMV